MSLVNPEINLTPEPDSPDKFRWEKFLADLRNMQCCLLLGPEINCLTPKGGGPLISILASFSEHLGEQMPKKKTVDYDPSVNNFYYRADKFMKATYDNDASYFFQEQIKSFSENHRTVEPEIYSKLAKLPFHSIVNMVPDNFMAKALRKRGYEFQEDYYDYKNDPTKTKQETILEEKKLLYNLFGSYEHPGSVVATQQEELEFIKNMVAQAPSISNNITYRFKDKKKSFLFLGFDFNDWYFRLVMDALKIPKPAFSYYPLFAEHHEVALLTREFYSEKFGIEFLQLDTHEFLDKIIEDYEELYGDANKKLSVVLDFYTEDSVATDHFAALYKYLRINVITTRVNFWEPGMIKPGDKRTEIDRMAKECDVYIPFVSTGFLSDEHCLQRINATLNQPDTHVIPIRSDFGLGPYNNLVPNLNSQKVRILPRDESVLSAFTGGDLDKVCSEIAISINCMIR